MIQSRKGAFCTQFQFSSIQFNNAKFNSILVGDASDDNEQEQATKETLPENAEAESSPESGDSDIEDLKIENKSHKPFRDNKEKTESEVKCRSVRRRKNLDENEIKKRVKKTISQRQKQERRQRLRKGESSVFTKARKENRITIKEGINDE